MSKNTRHTLAVIAGLGIGYAGFTILNIVGNVRMLFGVGTISQHDLSTILDAAVGAMIAGLVLVLLVLTNNRS